MLKQIALKIGLPDTINRFEKIFPLIDEESFSCLYNDKASRPNTPVNVCVGALIIKELFNMIDDEMVESIAFDIRFQYVLHTTSFEEQPLSDKTLSRFRKRCYTYELTSGIDLIHETIIGLSGKIAKLMKISGQIQRMDSLMVASNIKRLTRMELLYVHMYRTPHIYPIPILLWYFPKPDTRIINWVGS